MGNVRETFWHFARKLLQGRRPTSALSTLHVWLFIQTTAFSIILQSVSDWLTQTSIGWVLGEWYSSAASHELHELDKRFLEDLRCTQPNKRRSHNHGLFYRALLLQRKTVDPKCPNQLCRQLLWRANPLIALRWILCFVDACSTLLLSRSTVVLLGCTITVQWVFFSSVLQSPSLVQGICRFCILSSAWFYSLNDPAMKEIWKKWAALFCY